MTAGMRLRSARARAKALSIIAEITGDLAWTRLLLIASKRDDDLWTVVPGGMSARDMAQALRVAAEGVVRMAEHEKKLARVGDPVRIDITERGDGPLPGADEPLARECRIAESGAIEAPPGEAFVFCGECGASRWAVTSVNEPTGPMRRLVCIGCANEVAVHRVIHEAGHA